MGPDTTDKAVLRVGLLVNISSDGDEELARDSLVLARDCTMAPSRMCKGKMFWSTPERSCSARSSELELLQESPVVLLLDLERERVLLRLELFLFEEILTDFLESAPMLDLLLPKM
mmetsp:Transcript_95473/g.165852  ORF Transcript_95473/g.165852 Transcript_95473/m.165852 type:complete len:116 (-) Transcript_95473:509-856(-)